MSVGVLARAYRFSLILSYTMVIDVCFFVDVRAVLCAQFGMIPFHTQVCVYVFVCVCVLLCWCAHTGFP